MWTHDVFGYKEVALNPVGRLKESSLVDWTEPQRQKMRFGRKLSAEEQMADTDSKSKERRFPFWLPVKLYCQLGPQKNVLEQWFAATHDSLEHDKHGFWFSRPGGSSESLIFSSHLLWGDCCATDPCSLSSGLGVSEQVLVAVLNVHLFPLA